MSGGKVQVEVVPDISGFTKALAQQFRDLADQLDQLDPPESELTVIVDDAPSIIQEEPEPFVPRWMGDRGP